MAKSSTPHLHSAEEIGFLAGGPGRAAEAALARLMDGGLVRISREGLVTAVHQNGYGATTAIEAHILAGLGGAGRPIGLVVGPAATGQEMDALRRVLVGKALVHGQWGRPSGGTVAFRLLLVLLGIAFLVAGFVTDGKLLFVAFVAWFVAFLLRDKKMLTPLGKRALSHARTNPRGRVDAVALYGLRGVVGRQRVADLYGLPPHVLYMAPLHHHRKKKSHSGGCGSSCASSSSCSSSSCSSSSCSSSSCSSSNCSSSNCSSSSCSSSSCSSSSSSCSSSSSSCSSSSSSSCSSSSS